MSFGMRNKMRRRLPEGFWRWKNPLMSLHVNIPSCLTQHSDPSLSRSTRYWGWDQQVPLTGKRGPTRNLHYVETRDTFSHGYTTSNDDYIENNERQKKRGRAWRLSLFSIFWCNWKRAHTNLPHPHTQIQPRWRLFYLVHLISWKCVWILICRMERHLSFVFLEGFCQHE